MIKDTFIERKIYSDIIEKRIRDLKDGYRQNIAIIGDELVGKTFLLFNFINKFCDNRIVIIYIENRPESLQSFTKRFIGVLLYNFLSNSGIPLKEDLDFLIEKSCVFIPGTVEKIKGILYALEKRKKTNIFTEVLSLCEILNQETGKRCVVIFDEFLNLETLGIKDLYEEWSKILILQKNTMYIIVSSMKFKTKAILAKNLSLLFGNFETLHIEPFDNRTSEYYLDRALGSTQLKTGLKNFIVHFTGGSPFYLKLLSSAYLKSNKNNMSELIEEMLFDSSGILNQKFSNYIKRFDESPYCREYISILYLIASGHNKVKAILHLLHKSKKELDSKIAHLLELDVITRSGDFLKITDRIFGFWLKFVYREKLHSLTFDDKNQKSLFRDNMDSLIQEYLKNAEKPITEIMTELMRLFENDTIQIERKKLRLNHFREIKPLEFNKGNLKHGLIGRASDALWIMAFKHDSLTEDDIAVFAKECKKYHHKLQKKIIIAFRDIDANARLRALEEKIWTWDIDNLNQILDLYSKPRVISCESV
jgi:hypothetical protein